MTKARVDLGLTVEQCAVRLGVTRATLHSWEHEKTSPSLAEIGDIAKKLSISPSLLVFGRERAA